MTEEEVEQAARYIQRHLQELPKLPSEVQADTIQGIVQEITLGSNGLMEMKLFYPIKKFHL